MSFGKKLKNLLEDRNITQTDLAEKLKIRQSVVNRWVKGYSNNPKMETLEKLSKVFSVPVEYFVSKNEDINTGYDEEKKPNKNTEIEYLKQLIEKQNKLIEEKDSKNEERNKRLEAEINLLKKEIELLKK